MLHHACESGNVSLVQTFVRECEVDVNLPDSHNNTPLHVAAFWGQDEVALCLLDEFGCDPNIEGQYGRTLLHSACKGGSVHLVQTLHDKEIWGRCESSR